MSVGAGRASARTAPADPGHPHDPAALPRDAEAADAYRALVRAELAAPVDGRVAAMAAAIAAGYPGAARAMLFYGSCLRAAAGEGALDGQMLDFYLIVAGYRAAYGRGWRALANRVLPPNVFPFEHEGLIAKYAVLSEDDFARLASVSAREPSVLARFAQPARLVWTADEAARATATASVAQAAPALLALVAPLVPAAAAGDPLAVWRAAFALTYATELRAERTDRSGTVVDADPARYRRFGAAIVAMTPGAGASADPALRAALEQGWARFRRRGKLLTLARLAKASTTFAGGIDYLAWKINRHAGANVVIRPWQRRFPILGALTLLPRLLVRGAVR